ncbi:MAG: YHYH protein [Aliishimia sp.]
MKHPSLFVCFGLLSTPAFSDTHGGPLHHIEHFFENATVISGPEIVDCTLSRGTETSCFKITVKAEPQNHTPGPWCPTSITDSADQGGIWLNDGKVHDVDGIFVNNLKEFYDDDTWQLYDPDTGNIRVTDTKTSCEAAARPDVDPAFNNYCVQCLPEYMPQDATMTYIIPLQPARTWRTNPTQFGGSGVAYNGIRLDGPAPVDAILSAHTIAPFDDCGGHVNTHVGYHYHAVTDCLQGTQTQAGHAAQIGIAMDGHGIFARALADGVVPSDLDRCNGHTDEFLGYHYHAGEAGSNAILPCLRAESGCSSEDPDRVCDASARPSRP